MRAFLLDDEPLAVSRLRRMLEATGRVEVVGTAMRPLEAAEAVRRLRPDVLFLDIEMPGLTGFELLDRLAPPLPLVVFTTAHDRYAVAAFKVESLDYLLKPIAEAELDRAVTRLERELAGGARRADVAKLIEGMRALVDRQEPALLTRIGSRTGDRVEFVDVADVTHFYARDKLAFATTAVRSYAIDMSLAQLEARLPPSRWVRIHRATLVNIDAVKELHRWFGGRLAVRLKNGAELQVARDRVALVRQRLGI